MVLEVKQIGLAAFMKMNGCVLNSYNGKLFTLYDPENKTLDDWSLDYSNSCCQRHDAELLVLRDIARRTKNRR